MKQVNPAFKLSTCHVQATDLGVDVCRAGEVILSVGGYAGRGEAVKMKLFYNPYHKTGFESGTPELGK